MNRLTTDGKILGRAIVIAMNTVRKVLASWAYGCWVAGGSGYVELAEVVYRLMNFKTRQGKWEHENKKDL